MKVDQQLVDAAIRFVNERFPNQPWEGAAAMYLEDGTILTSTAPAVVNESVSLCHETGAICEAYARNGRVVASVCVSRNEQDEFVILSPCGVCQERLWYWGGSVQVAIPEQSNAQKWRSIPLHEITPHYWRKPFMETVGTSK
jgi:cytidine deaminase